MISKQKRIVSFSSEDGFVVNSLFLSGDFKRKKDYLEAPVVLFVHGVLGNFLARGTPRILPNALVENGFSTLSINTRMAFTAQVFGDGIFDEAIQDVRAAVNYLADEGFKNIILLGWSLGANLGVYYAVNDPHPRLKGVILEGCSYSLPLSNKKRLEKWESIPSYDHIYEIAKKVLGPDPLASNNDRIFIIYRAWGPTFKPEDVELFTYKTWWSMRSPEAHNAKTNEIISGLKVPALFIHGENDYVVSLDEPTDLVRILNEAGNEDVELVFIPDARHDCMENAEATVPVLVKWLTKIARRNKPG